MVTNNPKSNLKFSDAVELHAGFIAVALGLMPEALAREPHRVLATTVSDYEARRHEWTKATERRRAVEAELKEADRKCKALVKSLPDAAALMLDITEPAPGATDYTKLDVHVRLENLVLWIRASASPLAAGCADSLDAFRDRRGELCRSFEDAERVESDAKHAFGAARIKLQSVCRETDLFIRLNSPPRSPAMKALMSRHWTHKLANKPHAEVAPHPAANDAGDVQVARPA